ncbi:MAG: polysaccharide deacetylase family protein [Candidatus Aminicenantaceae bacterium]
MKRKHAVNLTVSLIAAALLLLIVNYVAQKLRLEVFVFEGLSGPSEPAVVSPPDSEPLSSYTQGNSSRLAILLTDTESSWLGLAHGLKSLGVPISVTTDYRRALEHRAVLVYPVISGRVLEAAALKALAAFPRGGGTLIAVNVLGGGLDEVFGFEEVISSRERHEIRFDTTQSLVSDLHDSKESVLRIYSEGGSEAGNPPPASDPPSDQDRIPLGTVGYTAPRNKPLAVFEDGTAAIIQKPYASGAAYAFGIDLGFLILKGYNYREVGMARSYVNEYEPTLDVLLGLLKKIYLAAEPDAVTLAPVPWGRPLAVMITHDVDYPKSLRNSLRYAEYEKSQGIRATYFIQTKYIRDWNDDIFFNDVSVEVLRELEALGMEVGSHSVSHAELFSDFPLGTGTEQYPAYRPFIKRRRKAVNGTILGELRISKFLLDHFLKGAPVVSFRPGFLSNPSALPQALMATGFLYTSTITANKSLTHLPFQLTYNRDFRAEVNMYEFPITVEDERQPRMGDRLDQAVELARKISRSGGIFVVLIHPDELGHKFEFEKGFIEAVKDFAWFGSISDFGAWWAARDKVELDVSSDLRQTIVTLDIPERIYGLTLQIPAGFSLLSSLPEKLEVSFSGTAAVLGDARGRVQLTFQRSK